MEDFEKIAMEREREILARRDKEQDDPRDSKGLIKVEDHPNLGRDPNSNAIINTDKAAYEAYIKAREQARLSRVENEDLKSEISELKELVKLLVEKNDK